MNAFEKRCKEKGIEPEVEWGKVMQTLSIAERILSDKRMYGHFGELMLYVRESYSSLYRSLYPDDN